jgi:5-methylcytosine-specific restriction endonuclease McrA
MDRVQYNAYMREYMLARYHARRARAIEILGGKCAECDSIDRLELDHKERLSKAFELAKIWCYKESLFWKELEKCQLLCFQCHRTKSILERGLKIAKGTHGTLSASRYCKCDLCKNAKRDYMKTYIRPSRRKL